MPVYLLFFPIFFAPLLVFIPLVFPEHFSYLLDLLYTPWSRIAVILFFMFFYYYFSIKKKAIKDKYDYIEDLSIVQAFVGNVKYHYSGGSGKNSQGLYSTIYIDSKQGYDFSLKFENRFERILKWMHLVSECQTGYKKFDDTIYIVSDDRAVCKSLQENNSLRETILELFYSCKEKGFKVGSLKVFDGKLILSVNSKKKMKDEEESERILKNISDFCASQLHYISQELLARKINKVTPYREPSSRYIYLILGLFSFLLINGMVKIFLDTGATYIAPRLVHRYELVPDALLISLIFFIIYALISLKVFYKSTRLAASLFIGATFGMAGFFLSSITALKEMNLYLDNSKTKISYEKVVKKRFFSGKSSSYHVTLSNYDEMRVSHFFYNNVSKNELIEVSTREGFLGAKWISKFDKVSNNE